MGLVLGFPSIITALYIAFLTGAIVSIILILWKKKKYSKENFIYRRFLAAGAWLIALAGAMRLLTWAYQRVT